MTSKILIQKPLTSLRGSSSAGSAPMQRRGRHWQDYDGLTTSEIFTKVCATGVRGKSADLVSPYYSGSGSHDRRVVDTYVKAVSERLSGFSNKPDMVDLGCGDFAVGSRIRPFCGRYTACDIVPQMIKWHREYYSDLDVEFLVRDIRQDRLPPGEVASVRQVQQHLSNAQIAKFLERATPAYRYFIVSEHVPDTPGWVPNIDMTPGPETRIGFRSGVDPVKSPFALRPLESVELCALPEGAGVIRTTAPLSTRWPKKRILMAPP